MKAESISRLSSCPCVLRSFGQNAQHRCTQRSGSVIDISKQVENVLSVNEPFSRHSHHSDESAQTVDVAAGAIGVGVGPASAHYNSTRCDRDGDDCYRVRCDNDGDDCVRVRHRYYRRGYGGYGNYGYSYPSYNFGLYYGDYYGNHESREHEEEEEENE